MALFGADITLSSRDYEARLKRHAMQTRIRIESEIDLGVARQRQCSVRPPGGHQLAQTETIIPQGVCVSLKPVRPEAYAQLLASALIYGVPLVSYRDLEGPGGEAYRDLTCLWHQSGDPDVAVRLVLDHMDRGFRGDSLTLDALIEGARPILYRRSG